MENIIESNKPLCIPRNFVEFYTRYSTYVRNFARGYMKGRPMQEQQDRESELTCFLLSLPAKSKFRLPGANGIPDGCTDRIMTFDPKRGYSDSAGHFWGYLHRILRNQFLGLEARKQSNPVTRQGTMRIVADTSPSIPESARHEIRVDQVSAIYQSEHTGSCNDPQQNATVFRFIEFVGMHNPELVPVLETISSCTSYSEAQPNLRIDRRYFNRAKLRLRLPYTCFTSGNPVPRQRRRYRLRRAKSARAA